GAEADIGSGARRHRLEVVHQRLEGGGGVRSELTQDERLVFVFEVRLDGPPTDRELESRACIVRSAGAQPVWFVLHMKGQEISLEYPCIPVVKVTGALFVVPSENAKVSLDAAVDQIIAAPDAAIRWL